MWRGVDSTFQRLGAHKVLGDPCTWIWTEPVEEPRNDGDRHRVIGYISGHVDDFNGDTSYPRWLQVKDQINKAYGWGTVKSGSYRHVGADIVETHNSKDGRYLEINQDFYTETLAALADLDIDAKMWH